MAPQYPFEQFWKIESDADFEQHALAVFRWQYVHIPIYKAWVDALGIAAHQVASIADIPFLPIQFFKSHTILPDNTSASLCFKSSGTTGNTTSRHWVANPEIYQQSCVAGFNRFYGDPAQWCFVSLLPSYLENGDSSLVYMMQYLHQFSKYDETGFYRYVNADTAALLRQLSAQKTPTVVVGVTYALLDLAEQFPDNYAHLIFMETGGMKGRRKELIRAELHEILKEAFQVPAIHSEYGMTELLSQAYSNGNGLFATPPWMRIVIRQTNDPMDFVLPGATGGINVIDLSNINSCAFIATQDLGRIHPDGRFEVLGRFDHSDVRGCNLLVQ